MRILSGRPVRLVGIAVALVSTLGLAACAADQTDLQNKVKQVLSGNSYTVNSGPSCPSNVKIKAGVSFTCTANLTRGSQTCNAEVHAHIITGNKFQVDTVNCAGGTPTPQSTPATTTT